MLREQQQRLEAKLQTPLEMHFGERKIKRKIREHIKRKQPVQAVGIMFQTNLSFVPSCGHSMATEKECVSCKEVILIDFGFCPHCGVSQE